MYGYNRNSGIHPLANYKEALYKWESTKPIRGRAEDVRPLGNRRQADQHTIRFNPAGVVECVLYKTPVVSFWENGDIVIKNAGYNSQSTCHFLDEVLWDMHSRIYANEMLVGFKRTPDEWLIIPEDGLTLKRDENGNLMATRTKAHMVHTVDRTQANIVRARYSEFTKYLSRMCRLKGNSLYLKEDMKTVFGTHKFGNADVPRSLASQQYDDWVASAKLFNTWVTDTNAETKNDSFYKALLHMAWSFGNEKWGNGEATGHVLHEKKAVHALNDLIIGLNRSEILKEKVLPIGKVSRDSYGTFFRYGWRRYHEQAS